MKEYKVYTFEDSPHGHDEMQKYITYMASDGWTIKDRMTLGGNYKAGKTCCLGALFLPLALLGKEKGKIQVTFERDVPVVQG